MGPLPEVALLGAETHGRKRCPLHLWAAVPSAPLFPSCVNTVSCTYSCWYLHCPLTFPRHSQALRTLLAHTGQTSLLKITSLCPYTFSKIKNYYIHYLERQKASPWCLTTSQVPSYRVFCYQCLSSDMGLSHARKRTLHLSPSNISGLLPAHFSAFSALGMAALTSSVCLFLGTVSPTC